MNSFANIANHIRCHLIMSRSGCTVVCLSLLLSACSADIAFRKAKDLDTNADYENALIAYQTAVQADPQNAEYRLHYAKAKQHAVSELVRLGESAHAAGKVGEASSHYLRALKIEENNPRVLQAVARIERDNRHAQYVAEAQAMTTHGNLDGALSRLDIALSENPQFAAARSLRISIEGMRPPVASALDTSLSDAFRQPVSIEFRDAELRQVFEVLSRSSGLNFVFDKEVRAEQRTTLFLRNSTVQQALSLVLLTNQLERRILDVNSVLIYPQTTQKVKEYQPLSVRSIMLANASAKSVSETLRTILKTRDVVVDEKQNMLIIRDTPEAIRHAERLIALQDQAPPEVMLEVEVLEVQRSRLLQLGVQFPSRLSLAPLIQRSASASAGTSGSTATALTLNDLLQLNQSKLGVTVDPLSVTANRNVSDVRVLANPRIRVLNHEKARIVVGQKVPTVTNTTTATGFVAGSVQYLDVGLKLHVEPTISPDGDVTIKMELEVSSILDRIAQKDGSISYQLGTRNAETILRLHDGENQVLAGLINDTQSAAGSHIPGLGDIPFLGRLFGYHTDDNQQSEIILSITPRILRAAVRPHLSNALFDTGTELSLKTFTPNTSASTNTNKDNVK